MPVPESYASRRYAGREETTYSSTYSQTRSATRPGVLTPSYTSKLASSTLPPRPSFERKSSIESSSSSSRYLSGSRTIPSYGTPSIIRGAASPNRATTSILRREVPSVSDRIKSYDSAPSGEKEFVSRFLRPREATVAPTTSFASKSNAYLTSRERSSSRDSGYSSSLLGSSSAHPVLGGRERERNVRGNIAARAASIGPSALSTRSSRNGHTTMSQQSSTEDGDNYNTSPTLGGRFRSSRDKNDYEKEAGLSGLRNIGNTCFMNSVLQCLSNTKPLLEYIVRKNYSSDINTTTSGMKGALIRAFADLCLELWRESKSTVDTSAFKDQVQRFAPRFMGYSQQDAQEFLRYLLEGLHEDINRVDTKPPPILTEIDDSLSDSNKAAQSWKRYLRCDDSRVVDLFVGQLKSSLKCTTCGHCSVTFDPFWDLSLPIPSKTGQVKLSQCLELFTKEEILDGDEKPTCSKCATRRKCTKSFSIQKFPKILVIHLKRFSPTERYRGKLSTSVDFPLVGLDMTPYAASRSTGCVYNLYGVANHSGSTYSGHYVAYCKHPYTGDWHCYNDSRVSPISSQSVVSSDGYLLFYELTNSSD